MKIDIHGHQIEITEALRAHIERRLQFTLGRFGARIAAVTVTVEDLNGPRGGVDKQCHITVTLASAGRLRVEVLGTDITAAVDQAADRIGSAIAREFGRHHSYQSYRPCTSRISGTKLFQRHGRTVNQEDVT